MPTVQELLLASRAASSAARAVPRPAAVEADDPFDLTAAAKSVGAFGLNTIAAAGNFLDLPGSMVRDVVGSVTSGKWLNPFDQLLTPFSDVNRKTGRQILEDVGMRRNREGGITDWWGDPGEAGRDIAGFTLEVLLDPFGPVGKVLKAPQAIAAMQRGVGRAAAAGVRAVPGGARALQAGGEALSTLGRLKKKYLDAKVVNAFQPAAQKGLQKFTEEAEPHIQESLRLTADAAQIAEEIGWSVRREVPDILEKTGAIARYLADADARRMSPILEDDIVSLKGMAGANPMKVTGIRLGKDGAYKALLSSPTDPAMKDLPFDVNDLDLVQGSLTEVPERLMPVLDEIADRTAKIRELAVFNGVKLANHIDETGQAFFYRYMLDAQQQAILIQGGGLFNKHRSAALRVAAERPEARDLLFQGMHGTVHGKAGFRKIATDPIWDKKNQDFLDLNQKFLPEAQVADVDGRAVLVLPGHAGFRHIEKFAEKVGMDPIDLWRQLDLDPETAWAKMEDVETALTKFKLQLDAENLKTGGGKLSIYFGKQMFRDLEAGKNVAVPLVDPQNLDAGLRVPNGQTPRVLTDPKAELEAMARGMTDKAASDRLLKEAEDWGNKPLLEWYVEGQRKLYTPATHTDLASRFNADLKGFRKAVEDAPVNQMEGIANTYQSVFKSRYSHLINEQMPHFDKDGLLTFIDNTPGPAAGKTYKLTLSAFRAQQAELDAAKAAMTAPFGPARARVAKELVDTIGYPQEQADALMGILDAQARSMAVEIGGNPDDYYTKFTMRLSTPADVGQDALRQPLGREQTPAFKRWFGDWEADPANASKVVDNEGKPLVVYHGTGTPDLGVGAKQLRNKLQDRASEEWRSWEEAEEAAGPLRKRALAAYEGAEKKFASEVQRIASPNHPHFPLGMESYDFSSPQKLAESVYKAATYPERESMWKRGFFQQHAESVRTNLSSQDFDALKKAHQEAVEAKAAWKGINPRPKLPKPLSDRRESEALAFDTGRWGANDPGYYAAGSYFTDNAVEASRYAEAQLGGRPGVLPAYLSIRKPFILGETKDPLAEKLVSEAVDKHRQIASVKKGDLDEMARAFALGRTEGLKAAGYDGMVVKTKQGTEYIVFEDVQVKSIHNRGTWGPGDTDILYQPAYHAGPNVWQPEPGFPNGRPRLDKIGTGSGKQNYGWGVYLSGSEDVADAIQKQLGPSGQKFNLDIPDADAARMMDYDLPMSAQPGIASALRSASAAEQSFVDKFMAAGVAERTRMMKGATVAQKAAVAIHRLDRLNNRTNALGALDNATGKDVITAVQEITSPKQAAEFFRGAGIPGNKFLDDAQPIGAGQKNFVVWDQDVLDRTALLEKNGQKIAATQSAGVTKIADWNKVTPSEGADEAFRYALPDGYREIYKASDGSGWYFDVRREGKVPSSSPVGYRSFEEAKAALEFRRTPAERAAAIARLDFESTERTLGTIERRIASGHAVTDPNEIRFLKEKGLSENLAQVRKALAEHRAARPDVLMQDARGAVEFLKDSKALVHFFESKNISTALHEIGGHVTRRNLPPKLQAMAEKAFGVKPGVSWSKEQEEAFATGLEEYVKQGKAPTKALEIVFQKFMSWLKKIYDNLRGKPQVNISPEMKQFFDSLHTPTLPDNIASQLEFGGFSQKTVNRHEGLAELLRDRENFREFGGFGNNPLVDHHDGMKRAIRSIQTAKLLRDYVADTVSQGIRQQRASGVYSRVRMAGEAGAGVRTGDLIEHMEGLDPEVWMQRVFDRLKKDGTYAPKAELTDGIRTEIMETMLDPRVVQEFTDGFKLMDAPSVIGDPLKFIDSFTTVMKSGLLSTPARINRDALSSILMGWTKGIFRIGTEDPKHIKNGISLMNGKTIDWAADTDEIRNLVEISGGNPNSAAERLRVFKTLWASRSGSSNLHDVATADALALETSGQADRLLDIIPGARGENLYQQIKRGAKGQTLGQNLNIVTNVAGVWTKDAAGRAIQKSTSNIISNISNHTSNVIDKGIKLGAMMSLLQRGGKAAKFDDAYKRVSEALLNYQSKEFSTFERSVLKRIFPFYSFMSRSISLVAGELMTNPGGRLGQTLRAQRLGQGGESYTPYDIQDTAAIPLGKDVEGNVKFLTGLGLMHEDAMQYLAPTQGVRGLMQKVLGSMNPAIKIPVEYALNTSTFFEGPMGGRRLDDLDPTMGRLMQLIGERTGMLEPLKPGQAPVKIGGSLGEAMAANSPAAAWLRMARTSLDPRKEPSERLMNVMTGLRTRMYNKEAQIRELRDRLSAVEVEMGARPLTLVIGSKRLEKEARERGDSVTADRLKATRRVIEMLRKEIEKPAVK